jgi:hypothetical protein
VLLELSNWWHDFWWVLRWWSKFCWLPVFGSVFLTLFILVRETSTQVGKVTSHLQFNITDINFTFWVSSYLRLY